MIKIRFINLNKESGTMEGYWPRWNVPDDFKIDPDDPDTVPYWGSRISGTLPDILKYQKMLPAPFTRDLLLRRFPLL
jgi:hypothetical protein